MTGGVQVKVGDIIAPSGVYRGDRDSFVFLMNPDKPIDDAFYGERRPILIDLVHLPHHEVKEKYAHLQWTAGTLTGEAFTTSAQE